MFFFFFFFLVSPSLADVDMKIQSLENCSSTQQTFYIDKCEFTECCMNFTCFILKPVDKVFVQFVLMRQEKSGFKSIFKVRSFDWCSIISGSTKPNSLVKPFLKAIDSRLPPNMKKCPLQGRMAAYNVPIKNKFMSIFPSGIYRVSAHGYSEEDPNIFYFALTVKVDS